ncbi:MAG: twin-arginine translocase TatA/TatE family subunit [Deltaproteobacteria bacterium]|nr:twin-arginine translocase TatA/TatE family subunit [Deltaproteobacteria bacterium]
MFGIGSGELILIALVVLIAVGPKRMPQLMKAVGKGMRDLRKASTDLRKQSGLDDLMREDPLGVRELEREIRRPVAPQRNQKLTAEMRKSESPTAGVDVALARHRLEAEAERKAEDADEDEVAS